MYDLFTAPRWYDRLVEGFGRLWEALPFLFVAVLTLARFVPALAGDPLASAFVAVCFAGYLAWPVLDILHYRARWTWLPVLWLFSWVGLLLYLRFARRVAPTALF